MDNQSVISFLFNQELTQEECNKVLKLLWLQDCFDTITEHAYLYRHLSEPETTLASLLLAKVEGDKEKIKVLLEVFARAI